MMEVEEKYEGAPLPFCVVSQSRVLSSIVEEGNDVTMFQLPADLTLSEFEAWKSATIELNEGGHHHPHSPIELPLVCRVLKVRTLQALCAPPMRLPHLTPLQVALAFE